MLGIIRPWSPPSCPTPRSWRPSGRRFRPCRPGIYLNTGSVGPLPAETAAAMAEMEVRERDVGRAHLDDFARLPRSGWPRRGPASPRVRRRRRRRGRPDPRHDRRDERRRRCLPDWRRGGRAVTSAHEHAGALGPLIALRDRMGVEVAFVDAGDDGDDDAHARRLRCRDHARHPPRLDLARPVDDRGGHAGRPDRRAGPRARRARRRRRRPGRRRDPGPLR